MLKLENIQIRFTTPSFRWTESLYASWCSEFCQTNHELRWNHRSLKKCPSDPAFFVIDPSNPFLVTKKQINNHPCRGRYFSPHFLNRRTTTYYSLLLWYGTSTWSPTTNQPINITINFHLVINVRQRFNYKHTRALTFWVDSVYCCEHPRSSAAPTDITDSAHTAIVMPLLIITIIFSFSPVPKASHHVTSSSCRSGN